MKSTIDISEGLLQELDSFARRTGRSREELVEEALARFVRRSGVGHGRGWMTLPVSSQTGGVRPGVDLSRNAEIRDLMDAER
jgi:hypothetical protein